MGLIPGDLVTDLDLLALDSSVGTDFGAASANLVDKRRVAVNDWLRPRLEQAGLNPILHLTRRPFEKVFTFTEGVYTDVTEQVSGAGPTALTSIVAETTLYLGSREPFRAIHWPLADGINNTSAEPPLVEYFNGRWAAFDSANSFVNGTVLDVSSVPYGRGGRMEWTIPDDWFARQVGSDTRSLYWVRVGATPSMSSQVTNEGYSGPPAIHGPLTALWRSRLTAPAAHYALHLLYREGIANSRGDWKAKAEAYKTAAEKGLELAVNHVRDEFDINEDDKVERVEINSVVPPFDPFSWERG